MPEASTGLRSEPPLIARHDKPIQEKPELQPVDTSDSFAAASLDVKLWIGFLVDTGRVPDSYKIKKGSPTPDVNLIKAFIRYGLKMI
ncbi:hypothetical protein N7471_006728 [Penicillium samsonianum]|uniref:uncharacterized protein n=1 Tax=Penicillium samsonianum TaxID=1882272 RepID=UPI0025468922|nr:uncharacterized protein N7471_006728 [Penicillium samsonianum]KAJ6140242.1 hypothetical protein N7471_006728 [Penicillium samsonianum]